MRLFYLVNRAGAEHCPQYSRAAVSWAMVYARKLDGWLECDWRQKKVEERRERIDEIARAM
jgi:hypothetical protein